jgi:hypothetical protein
MSMFMPDGRSAFSRSHACLGNNGSLLCTRHEPCCTTVTSLLSQPGREAAQTPFETGDCSNAPEAAMKRI